VGAGADRNKLCACGSERKFKKCCANRKQTNRALVFEFVKPTVLSRYEISADGQVRMYDDEGEAIPSSSWWTRSYPRSSKGEKTIIRVPVPTDATRLQIDDGLGRYKNLFSIDTNTTVLRGTTVSIACVGFAQAETDSRGGTAMYFEPVGAFEFHDCVGKPENLAWSILQSMIVSSPDYSIDHRYAIVTDSDLGNHGAYNEQSAPLFGDTFLAANIDLIYASADVTRGPLNEMIKQCDRVADRLKEALTSGQLPEPRAVLNGPCSHFRIVDFRLDVVRPSWLRPGTVLPFSMAS
jgi:hypothetical protein